jgi:hypothetical protein
MVLCPGKFGAASASLAAMHKVLMQAACGFPALTKDN